ncbi:unnamed protein product [Vitrella brassicaformis CCMP3155]|uniref:TLDc domain-containing protein n=1 Tax=Vitrella brassicaformis (strain CCMP3155) TaxID=1169540 RepID=A0A0G4EI95_VITBC|nr:unnamed protein product [Vitrella brassicaformis CCMP3155]|eukprot:CEL95968.1 unnamed protein product [Vitrella brassicaformis CCMP3155]
MADRLILTSQNSYEQIMQQAVDFKTKAEGDVKAITDEISDMVSARGGVWKLPDTDSEVHVNAGGVVFPVSRRALLMPFMAADPLYADYHALFMREITCYSAPQQTTTPHTASTASTADPTGSEDQAIQQYMKACEESLRTHSTAIKQLQGVRDDIKRFLEAMEPSFASPDENENEILSLMVLGRKVSMMRKTFSRLGPNHPLLTRFATNPPCWADRHVRQTPTKCFVTTVEFSRRIAIMPASQMIRPPLLEEGGERHFIEDIEMYGLRYQPYCNLPAADGHDFIAKSAEEWGKVIDMTGKHSPTVTLIYKSSRDTFAYPSFLNQVTGRSGLLFALRDGDTHRFGCFVDGPLDPPKDPTQTNDYKVPVFFFSLSGAYDAPTKIELSEDRQTVGVAGTQGVVKDSKGESCGNVAIGRGYLWLGFDQPGPAADLSSCQQWIKRDDLSEGYKGTTNQQDQGTLAQSQNFTCDEMEIWQVVSG